MPFCQLTLTATKIEAEFYADLLSELGALAVSLEDAKETPLFEPNPGATPLWAETKVIGLYEADIDREHLKHSLKIGLSEASFQSLHFETIQDENWILKSREQFKPLQFGENLWICPSWREIPAQTEQIDQTIKIILDPGLAFGTGSHPTTRLCLEYLTAHPPLTKHVLDYGCGSGILGIAAIKLGAKKVFAVDHDPQALLSVEENARLNGISDQELFVSLSAAFKDKKDKVDLILANILLEPLIQLAPQFNLHLVSKGTLIMSGILETQTTALIESYQAWFKDFQVEQLGEWVRVVCQKK